MNYLVPRKLRTRSQTNIFFCLSGQLLLKTFEILTMRETVNSSTTKPVQWSLDTMFVDVY